ncbi:MAG: von Willebrand factor type A domain-containing protein [Myxococcota bacterium]
MRNHLVLLALIAGCHTPPEAAPEPPPETEQARREEGRVGKKDAQMQTAAVTPPEEPAPARPEPVTPAPSPDQPARQAQHADSVARNAGVLGALPADGSGLGEGLQPGGVGGLIGTSGVALGSGGLGTRGTGVGGGGTAQGLGGLGSKGMGSGKSGYGSGGGNFGTYAGGYAPPAPVATGSEHYTDYGVNGHVLTESDAQSTFSIDVDTASFAVARSYLGNSTLPPHSAVRVEEFVNAQKYSYRPPSGDAPFAVNMEASPDPFRSGHHLLRVGVKAQEPKVDRDPVHLTFLVDVSGSMSAANKLPLAKRALHELVDHLGGEDRVALVTYAGGTRVVLEPTRASNPSAIHAAIDSLANGGGTAMHDGMTLAYDLALSTLEPGTENRVVLLSDGDANIGPSSHEQILAALKGYAEKGITMSTIGFGRGNYKDTLMEQLADNGDGNYFYIDTFKEAQKVFGQDLSGTIQTVARDVKIQVEFDPASVLSYRLIGYENRDIADKDFRNDKVDAGEIGSGHAVTALYDVILRDHPSDTLATVRMRSKPPGPDAPAVERSTTLPTSAVRDEFASATRDFRIAYTAATFAELLRASPHAEEITYHQVARMGRDARRNSDDDALIGLIETAGRLSGEDGIAMD